MSRLAVALLACAIALTACTSAGNTSTSDGATSYSAEVGSTDLFANAPQRFQIGVFRSSDQGVELLTSGAIDIKLSPFQGGPGTPLLIATRAGTRATWISLGGLAVTAVIQLVVAMLSGSVALLADTIHNLTMSSHVAPVAIDSRAQGGTPVPAPELHRDTVAGAIAAHRAALVLFATPVYCQSQFCGPSTDALERIAKTGPKDADYIHVEIYANYDKHQINRAAAQWLLRNGDLTEPWLYLIAPSGRIADRWGPLFDPSQVMTELRRVAG